MSLILAAKEVAQAVTIVMGACATFLIGFLLALERTGIGRGNGGGQSAN